MSVTPPLERELDVLRKCTRRRLEEAGIGEGVVVDVVVDVVVEVVVDVVGWDDKEG